MRSCHVDLFDIKNRPIPLEYLEPILFIRKCVPTVSGNWRLVMQRLHLCSHRVFLPSDYETLFSCVLSSSRDYLLDCEPTPYSIRYLT